MRYFPRGFGSEGHSSGSGLGSGRGFGNGNNFAHGSGAGNGRSIMHEIEHGLYPTELIQYWR